MMKLPYSKDRASLTFEPSLGFTLIELLITISFAAILMALAAPSFRDLIAGQKIKAASYDLMSALQYTRSEALKRNADVSLIQASGGWENGWTISATGPVTLSSHEAFTGLDITGSSSSLVYSRDGRITSTAGQTFDISSNVTSNVQGRCITLDLSGLPKSKIGGC